MLEGAAAEAASVPNARDGPAFEAQQRPARTRPRSLSTASLQSHGKEERRWLFRPQVMLHAGRLVTYSIVGSLWIITPLSWAYLIYTIVTLAAADERNASVTTGFAGALHYLFLAYCAIECPFSIYYRYLAFKLQDPARFPQFSRKYLRSVMRQALANGLDGHDALGAFSTLDSGFASMSSRPDAPDEKDALKQQQQQQFSLDSRHPYNMRNRKTLIPLSTPDLSTVNLSEDEDSFFKITKEHLEDVKSESPRRPQQRKSVASFIHAPLAYNDPRARDFREYMSGWFYGAPFTALHKLNLADWLAWSLYNCDSYETLVAEREDWIRRGKPTLFVDGAEDVDPDHVDIEPDKLGLVDHCVELIEARAACQLPEGRNEAVRVIKLTLDPVRITSRPIILYAFVWVLSKIMTYHVRRNGFRHVEDGDMEYIIKVPAGWQPEPDGPESKQPLLFLHGLGMGLAQYASVIHYLSTSPTVKDRPIVALIQPPISMAFFHKRYLCPPSMHTSSAGLKRMAERHHFDKTGMTVLSHSNGTTVHGWLLKQYPTLVRRSCFVDPVCFGLWEPHICYQFLYATARTPVDIIIRYFVGREPGVAKTLQRAFNWADNLLFPDQIPDVEDPFRAAFFLASDDSILNAERVRRYLRRHGVKEVSSAKRGPCPAEGGLKMHWGKKHGESMIGSGVGFRQIMRWVMLEPGELEESEDDEDEDDS